MNYFIKFIFALIHEYNNLHGKGKEYYDNGKLCFEGEYLNDKRRAGKGYDILNNIVY